MSSVPIVERYGEKFNDETYEYRQVTIRKEYANLLPKGKLLNEEEWRRLGIQMSYGWTNYCAYKPESNILLFRRPVGTDGSTGLVDPVLAEKVKEKFRREYGLK
ncbi:hypothetical protein WA588_002425 [Blastocystis sp. NMH]